MCVCVCVCVGVCLCVFRVEVQSSVFQRETITGELEQIRAMGPPVRSAFRMADFWNGCHGDVVLMGSERGLCV